MTTVAALAVDGTVTMAADSLTNIYDRPILDGARKIRRVTVGAGEALLGVCGDGGLADLVSYHLVLEEEPADDPAALRRWAATVAAAVTELASSAGLVDDGRLDGGLLLGYRGRLWHLTHAQAIPIPDGVAALGTGEGPAMGAMDVLRLQDGGPAETCARAVEVACARDKHSAPPIYVEHLPAAT